MNKTRILGPLCPAVFAIELGSIGALSQKITRARGG
jgi:hypothetical protein